MFMIYRGWGARLLRAMVQLSLDRHADAYEEIRPPTVVRTDTMITTGHLPKFDVASSPTEPSALRALPTPEVPLTSLHRPANVTAAELPSRHQDTQTCLPLDAVAAVLTHRGRLWDHHELEH